VQLVTNIGSSPYTTSYTSHSLVVAAVTYDYTVATATFTAHVYTDPNNSGADTQILSSQNLAGVTVNLLTGTGVATGQTATTDSSGNVSFTGLAAGSYEIQVVTPAGGTATQQTNLLTPTTLSAGGTANAIEGVYTPASFTAHVYTDVNGNGTEDTGDTSLGGVTVTLLDTTTGITVGSKTTDSSGNVTFTGLAPDSYQISVPGQAATTGDVVTQTSVTSTGAGTQTPLGTVVTLASGQTAAATEGLYVPGTFTAHVYTDANNNSTEDTGDTDLGGVTVTLLNTTTGTTVGSKTTDSSGNVTFTGLAPDSYQISVPGQAATTGDVVTQTSVTSTSGGMQTPLGTVVTLASGQTAAATEGVYTPPGGTATFTAHVYTDANGNGMKDGSDTDLSGVTVTLVDTTTGTTVGSQTTDSNGNVTFAGLAPDSYQISVPAQTATAGDVVTQTNVTSTGGGTQTPLSTVVTLASGQTAAATEGLYVPATINTHVYTDANGNSSQDGGDTNLAGVTVTLNGTPTGGSAITPQTLPTNGTGDVSFTGLAPGSYTVSVTNPATGDVTTQAYLVGSAQTLASGQTINAIDGLYVPATFTAHVYTDANGDSSQNGSDTNLAGVTVNLLDGSGNPTGRTAVTDASGNVSFGGLAPGSYEIAVVTPTGDGTTQTTNLQTPTVLASGGSASAIEGVFVPATFSTHVYTDANGDSSQNGSDTNLAGVTVNLLDGSGDPTGRTAVTDASGNVSFGGLAPGSYEIAVVTPAGDGTTQTTNLQTPTVLASGGSASAIEGVFVPATFSAHVYTDANGDSSQNGSDTNLAGVTVNLLDGSGNPTGRTAVTDASGNVSFGGLAPGSYEIAVVTPTGDGTTQTTNLQTPTVLASGGSASAIEGVYAPATFSAHVYTDANGDSSQNGSDTNLAGVTVNLLDGSGNPTGRTAVTDASGNVSFAGLAPGSYEIAVVTPTGDGTTQTTNLRTPTVLASGGSASAIEGVYVPATFSAHVYTDANGDSSQNGSDTNLAGVTVNLLDGSGNPTGRTAVTDASGNVSFAGLAPGSYEIAVVTPTGDGTTQTTNLRTPTVLASGGSASAVEGVYAPATFSAHVYTDANGDSSQNGSDTNLAGVTVNLLDGSGNPTGRTAVTDASGNVSFGGLAPGSYEIAVVTQTGDGTTQTTNLQTPTVLASGGSASAIEGVFVPATFSAHVYTDANGDSSQNGSDTNLAGVTVNLLDGSGNPTGRTAVTDTSGNVSFAGLAPGSYEIAVVTPGGDVTTQTTNLQTPTVLASGGSASAVEGVYAPATFNAHVYTDTNGTGTQNGIDPNLAGVTVKLLDGSGNPTGRTAVTDASGNVSFSGLAPGSYEIAVVTPGGSTVTQATNVQTPTTVASGGSAAAVEGLFVPATLSAHVYTDANGDGKQDTGDSNRAGVTVELLDGSGHPTGRTAVTDANGNVSFTGLPPGTYEIAVLKPDGSIVTQASNILAPITLAAGQTVQAIEGVDTTVIAIPTPTPAPNPEVPDGPKVANPLIIPAIGAPTEAPGDFNPLDRTAEARQLYVEGRNADGGPVPSWLTFDPTTMSFSGSPPTPLKKPLVMIVVIRDSKGNQTFHDVPIISGPSGDQTEFYAQLTSNKFKDAIKNGFAHSQQRHTDLVPRYLPGTIKRAAETPADPAARRFDGTLEGRSAFTTQLQAAGRMGKLATARALLDTWTRIDA